MTRRSAPQGASPERRRQASSATDCSAPPPDHDYDRWALELEGYTSDPLTADEWGAICLAESRDVALSEAAP